MKAFKKQKLNSDYSFYVTIRMQSRIILIIFGNEKTKKKEKKTESKWPKI